MKNKKLIEILERFDNDIDVYIQIRSNNSPFYREYTTYSMTDVNIAMQDQDGAIYLALGDPVIAGIGYHSYDGTEIKHVPISKK